MTIYVLIIALQLVAIGVVTWLGVTFYRARRAERAGRPSRETQAFLDATNKQLAEEAMIADCRRQYDRMHLADAATWAQGLESEDAMFARWREEFEKEILAPSPTEFVEPLHVNCRCTLNYATSDDPDWTDAVALEYLIELRRRHVEREEYEDAAEVQAKIDAALDGLDLTVLPGVVPIPPPTNPHESNDSTAPD